MTPRQVAAFVDTLPSPTGTPACTPAHTPARSLRRGIAPTVDRRLLDIFTVAGWLALIVAAVR